MRTRPPVFFPPAFPFRFFWLPIRAGWAGRVPALVAGGGGPSRGSGESRGGGVDDRGKGRRGRESRTVGGRWFIGAEGAPPAPNNRFLLSPPCRHCFFPPPCRSCS